MNKAGLLDALSDQPGQARDEISKTLEALLETIGSTLAKGDKLMWAGFGIFEIQRRAARPGRNPKAGAPIEIPGAILPKPAPGKLLKERVAEAHKPRESPKAKSKRAKEAAAEKSEKAKKK